MCGIAGILRMDGEKVDDHSLMRMASQMVHRGPDGQGIWKDTHVGLAHRRLSIIDLKTGDQPLSNEEGRFGSFSTARSITSKTSGRSWN